MEMIVEKDKVVSLIYELKISGEDQIFEQVGLDRPLTFLYGHKNLIEKFEKELEGLKCGDNFDFGLSYSEAYGPVNEKMIADFPMSMFMIDGEVPKGTLEINKILPMRDKDGRRLDAKVIKIDTDTVTLDFNHILAGKDLHFKGHVADIRSASEEEIQNGNVFPEPSGCEGCGSRTEHCQDGCSE
jgi:FKBP-type peptidyl-prolyl cis-trans isomerase SlyD